MIASSKPYAFFLRLGLLCAVMNGCNSLPEPRTRLASLPAPTPATDFIGIDDLGTHCYNSFFPECNGIVYTCKAGHIDTGHVRIAADYVRYLNDMIRVTLRRGDCDCFFKMNIEPSRYHVVINYPSGWNALCPDEQERIIDIVAPELSQYFAFIMTTWHEVITWFGFKTTGVWSEYPSAFSWEDSFSNLVGTRLGLEALSDTAHDFDAAMTIALRRELLALEIQPAQTSLEAAEKMKGFWYDGHILIEMKRRNLDIGLNDGLVTPTLIPGVCTDAVPQSYPVPDLDNCRYFGFTISLFIYPKELLIRQKILHIIDPTDQTKTIEPSVHLPILMEHIQKESLENGYLLFSE